MENDITKLGEGMKWEDVERSGAGAFRTIPISVRDYVKELQELLEKYPNAVFRDEGDYEERIGIYIQVPKTKSDLLHDKWRNSQPQIDLLESHLRALRSKHTSRPKIIESDVPIPKETLDKIDAEDPDGDYVLMGGRILIKEIFDKAGFEMERDKIQGEIKLLEEKREQIWTQYKEALKKENGNE